MISFDWLFYGGFPTLGGLAADFATLAGRRFIDRFPAARTAFLPTTRHFIDRRPRALFGLPGFHAAIFISFLDMFRLPFLLARITGFIALWHKYDRLNVSATHLAQTMPSPIYKGFRGLEEEKSCNLQSL